MEGGREGEREGGGLRIKSNPPHTLSLRRVGTIAAEQGWTLFPKWCTFCVDVVVVFTSVLFPQRELCWMFQLLWNSTGPAVMF